jgi:hypothetical protein
MSQYSIQMGERRNFLYPKGRGGEKKNITVLVVLELE